MLEAAPGYTVGQVRRETSVHGLIQLKTGRLWLTWIGNCFSRLNTQGRIGLWKWPQNMATFTCINMQEEFNSAVAHVRYKAPLNLLSLTFKSRFIQYPLQNLSLKLVSHVCTTAGYFLKVFPLKKNANLCDNVMYLV